MNITSREVTQYVYTLELTDQEASLLYQLLYHANEVDFQGREFSTLRVGLMNALRGAK